MMQKRRVGATNVESSVVILGGHGLQEFRGKPKPELKDMVEMFSLLVENGLTHFDTTFSRERQTFKQIVEETGLKEKVQPCIWYGWHDMKEETPDDIVEAFKFQLQDVGYEKAGMTIAWSGMQQPEDWQIEGFLKIKEQGLADAIGLGILAGGRLGEEYLYKTHQHWDFIAPYWNYSLRRQQFMVEFARENDIGVYAVGAFGRGAILQWPGVTAEECVRPWLKWIFREPSVFATALSLSSLKEAKQAIDACDDKPMSPEEVLYLHRMNFPIQHVDYRINDGKSVLQTFELCEPDAHGSNMIGGSMLRWKEKEA